MNYFGITHKTSQIDIFPKVVSALFSFLGFALFGCLFHIRFTCPNICMVLTEKIFPQFSVAQLRYLALLLTPQMHVPYKCGTIQRGIKQASQ